MQRTHRIFKCVAPAIILALFGFLKTAQATASFDSLSFKPATDHGYYLTVDQSQTLGQLGYAVGLFTEFSNDSASLFTANHTKIRDVIEHQVASQFGAALGLVDWLNLGVLVSFVPFHEFNSIATGASDDGFQMGDIRVNLKARLLNNEKHPVGVALVPFITFPTGEESHLVGNGEITGGGMLVLDSKRIGDRFSIALNVGGQARESVTFTPGTTIDDQFLYGAGANLKIAKPLQLVAEVNGWTPFENFFEDNNRNLEVNGALKIFPVEKLAITVGGGTGILDAVGAPQYRVFLGVAYRSPREEEEAPPPPPEPKEEVIRTNKIHFEFDKATIKPASYPILDDIVAQINERDDVESIRVEGHTDSKGSDEYNQRLSEKRAAAVVDYLVSHGVPREKLSSVGKGESEPISPNEINGKDYPTGRAENRRVEFHLKLKPGAKVKVIEEKQAPTFPEGTNP